MAAALERGEPIPKGLLDRPEVWLFCRPYWNGFWALSRGRQMASTGMAVIYCRIPYHDKAAYARDHGLAEDIEALDDFLYLVDSMDEEWLKLNQPKPGK